MTKVQNSYGKMTDFDEGADAEDKLHTAKWLRQACMQMQKTYKLNTAKKKKTNTAK